MKRKTKTQHKKRFQKVKKIIFWVFFWLLVSSFLLLACWWFRGWNGKEAVNLVIINPPARLPAGQAGGGQYEVVAVRPREKKLVEVEIPGNMMIKINGGGEWRVDSLEGLVKLEKSTWSLEALGWDLLEVPVDGIVRSLSWPERMRFGRYIKSLHEGQITRIDLGNLSAVRRVVDPSGTESLEVSAEKIAAQIEEWFQIMEIRQEGLAVAIQNASGETGAGAKLARILEHSGMNVVSVRNGEGEKALFVADKKLLKTETVKKLSQWLKIKPKVGQFEERAEILVVVN